MKFDLASDLHKEFWDPTEQIKWDGIGTSFLAVVLGDISFDINETYKTIVEISKHYKFVIFVDGNHEHNNECGFQQHNQQLKSDLGKYQNISFLNRSAIVLDGTAFVGANGWWTFDFMEPDISKNEAYEFFLHNNIFSEPFMYEVYSSARDDALVLGEIISKLTVDPAVNEIVMLTHTAPLKRFTDFVNPQHPVHFSRCGNSYMNNILNFDIGKKIKTWCFGHVHQDFDEVIDGIRYICHPRGRKDDMPHNVYYYPKMIEIS
jgi:hypothetical protein